MSATSRGGQRHADDFYVTPSWCVEVVRPHLPLDDVDAVIDAGCGDGAIGRALAPGGLLVGVELDAARAGKARDGGGYDEVHVADYTTWKPPFDASGSLVIANPPFALARAFVEHSLSYAGHVCMLLRLAWIASAGRRDLHRANPSDLNVLGRRPSFCASFRCKVCKTQHTEPAGSKNKPLHCGAQMARSDTDSADYAWFLWSRSAERGRVRVL